MSEEEKRCIADTIRMLKYMRIKVNNISATIRRQVILSREDSDMEAAEMTQIMAELNIILGREGCPPV